MASMEMNPSFWRQRRVLVTGHTGFKGAWLCLWLQKLGAEVVGFALQPPTQPSLFEEARVASEMRSDHGDVRDLRRLVQVVSESRPEIIIHMAAQSLVRSSYSDPVATYATNVMGTVHVLEAARGADTVRVVINVTSDKCYENREWVWGYREDEAMGGSDPYSSSKGCSELVTSAYRSAFFRDSAVAIASARSGNVIGGGDWAQDRFVPDFVRTATKGRTLLIRSPDAVRPWQFVLEPLRGYLSLVQALWNDPARYAGGWNFGPGVEGERPVRWLADQLAAKWGDGVRWERDSRQHPHEANVLKLDCSKARAHLGWRPRMTLDAALAAVVEWYKSHHAGFDMRTTTMRQIDEYVSGISDPGTQ